MGFYDITWTNCFQISMLQVYRSQQVVNRFFYQCEDIYSGSLSDLATAFYNAWNAVAGPCQSQEVDYDKVIVQELFGDRQSYTNEVTGGNGTQAGAELPAFFGARFTLTPLNTRVKKGRKILSGILEEMVDIDSVAAGYTASFNSFASFLGAVETWVTQDFTPVLLSPANTKHTGNVISKIGGAAFTAWSTQSSRKIGRGS